MSTKTPAPVALADLQRRFFRLIAAPESVAVELPAAAAEDPATAPLERWIRADSAEQAAERLDVYANMYFFRLLEIVGDDYAKLAALLGPGRFHNLVTAYLQAYPSTRPSVRWVGRHLAEHIAKNEPDLRAEFPAAIALARLEWLRGEAFDEADAPVVTADALSRVPPERWPYLRLDLQPSLRLAELDHDVLPLWLALENGADPAGELPAAPTADPPVVAMIWRREFTVWHRPVPPLELEAVRAALSGASFAKLCERLYPHAGEDTPVVAAGFLRDWITSGMVAGYSLPPVSA